MGSVFLARGDDLVRARALQLAADSGARRRARRVHRRHEISCAASRSIPKKEAMVAHFAGFAALMALILPWLPSTILRANRQREEYGVL